MSKTPPNRRIRGCVLVICNSFVNTPAEQTQLSNADANTMKRLWGSMLKCDSFPITGDANFIVHQDVPAQKMIRLLTDFSAYSLARSHLEYSYIGVVITTHGGLVANTWAKKWDPTSKHANLSREWKDVYDDFTKYGHDQADGQYVKEKMVEVLFGNDFRPIREEKIKKLFHNNAAKGWQDIPKFFILSYCRGNAIDYGVIRIPQRNIMGVPIGSRENESKIHRDAEEEAASLMPEISDVLAVYATHHSYLAFAGGVEFGSWLVTTIGKVFTQYAKNMHVIDMLTIVNKEMKKKEIEMGGNKMKAMSVYESSLEKHLYLCDAAENCGSLICKLMEELQLNSASSISEIRTHLYERGYAIPVGEAPQRDRMIGSGPMRHRGEVASLEQSMPERNERSMREYIGESRREIGDVLNRQQSRERDQRMHGLHMRYELPVYMDERRYERELDRRNVDPRYLEGPRVNDGRMQHYGEILLVLGLVAVSHMILPRFRG